MGQLRTSTGSFAIGIGVLAGSMCLSATMLLILGLGKKTEHA
jgi:hypothetical protein